MKKIILGFAVSIMLTSVAIAADVKVTTKPIVIKLTHVVKGEAPKGLASTEFKKIMESKFPGRVKVEVYHDNTLFKDREESEALELNAVNVIIPTTGKVATTYGIKEFELFDLPFLFNTHDDILKFTNSSSGEKLLNLINSKIKTTIAITYWVNDFQNFFGVKAFKKPSDFSGLVAGITSGGSKELFLKSLGVKETIVMPFSQIPKALKKDGEIVIDLSSNTNSNFYTAKIYESTKNLTLSKHDVSTYVFLANRRWFNSLPEDVKVGFVASANEAGLYHLDIAKKAGIADLEKAQKAGINIQTLTKEEKEEFKKKAVTVHENYLKNINKEFLNEVYTIVR